MKIGIIDDELHCIKTLEYDLRMLFPDFHLVFHSTKPKIGLQYLKENHIDLLFLDIEMPGMTGLELLQELNDLSFDVIFTTGHREYALAAFKARAINYLLKPVDKDELKEAVDRWKATKSPNKSRDEISVLLDQLKKEGVLMHKIAVPVQDGMEFLEVNQIKYCQSQSNYVDIFLACGKTLLISKTLKEVESALEEYHFLRPNRSFLVNPNYMQKYVRNDGGYIIMDDNQRISVSPAKKELVLKFFTAVERRFT